MCWDESTGIELYRRRKLELYREFNGRKMASLSGARSCRAPAIYPGELHLSFSQVSYDYDSHVLYAFSSIMSVVGVTEKERRRDENAFCGWSF